MSTDPGSSAPALVPALSIVKTMPLRIKVVTPSAFRDARNLSTPPGLRSRGRHERRHYARSMVAARHPLLRALEPVAASLGAELVAPKQVRAGDIPLEW